MKLTAYAQAVGPGVIQLWVGIFDTEQPPAPTFLIDRAPAVPLDAPVMTPIRDLQVGAGNLPVNHHGLFRFAVPAAGRPYLVQIAAGTELYEFSTSTLPASVPEAFEGSFNILLCSCYFQPEDARGLLGTIISGIQLQPHLTIMAGDQVYLDLPLLEDLPSSDPELSRTLGDKYRRNWTSTQLRTPGLEAILTRAPVVNVPDDHEFWNNFPFPQKQLPNTWTDKARKLWGNAAQALYEDYQLATSPAAAGATRLDVAPLRMLFVDMRCGRDAKFQTLMNPQAVAALVQWANDLIADRKANNPAVGVLSSGQAIFIDPPQEESKKVDVDAEMGNFDQFALVREQLARLADNGVPVVYLTGDVHWGRVASGRDQQTQRTNLYEVIASPSRLIRVPFLDSAKEAANAAKGIFGKKDPWPRHSEAEDAPVTFSDKRFVLETKYKRRGDHVAIVSFTRNGTGVDFSVTYYGIHPDKAISKSEITDSFPLRAA